MAVVVSHNIEYGAAVRSDPRLTPSNWNRTSEIVGLPLAFADTVMVPDTVALFPGAVIETVGGVIAWLAPPL